MRYYLGPWRQVTEDSMTYWAPPPGASAIDLRAVSQQDTPGIGFFAIDGVITDSDYTLLGESLNPRDIVVPEKLKRIWESRCGIGRTESVHLLGLLWDTLGVYSDPSGEDGPKPIMPGSNRCLELHLGGKLKSRPIGRERRENKAVMDCLKRDLARIRRDSLDGKLVNARTKQVDDLMHRRVLQSMVEKYKCDWNELVPTVWGKNETPKPHDTTITDTFDRTDQSGLGTASGGFTWTKLTNDRLDIVSNKAQYGTGETGNDLARANQDLSSDDHYSQAVAAWSIGSGDAATGVISRKDSSATLTFYLADSRKGTNNDRRIFRCVSGSFTSLATAVSETPANNDVMKLECDGSTIRHLINATQKQSVTDTNITGNLRCGLRCDSTTTSNIATYDSFEAADISAPAGIKFTQLERDIRGVNRGVWTG